MKIVGMIPARLGSTRVINKNLRLLDKKPLVQHILDAAKGSKLLDEIYLNSEGEIFREIAHDSDINFYHRPSHLSTNQATNDDFVLDFIQSIECDIVIQLLPTSPFISSKEIDAFISQMAEKKLDTLISVADVQIECIYENNPINFVQRAQTPPSQDLTPIKSYACGIMGWKADKFVENMNSYKAAYHGGDGKTDFFTLKGNSTVDIDNEEDFVLAEAVSASIKGKQKKPEYYQSKSNDLIADADVKRILSGDGVLKNTQEEANKEVVNIEDIINLNGQTSSWSHTVINSKSNSATLIAQLPGEGNRKHFHPDWDEWWYILQGEWIWTIEGKDKIIKEGQVVFIERGRQHKITASGNKMAIRLAVSRYDVDHVYDEKSY